jgi:hypothetical protein
MLDLSFSFTLSFSTTPGPAIMDKTLPTYGSTVGTCVAQGFFVQLGLGAPLYNACFCIYYLLSVRYHVSDECLMKFAVPAMHFLIMAFSIGMAVTGLVLKLFNYAGKSHFYLLHSDVRTYVAYSNVCTLICSLTHYLLLTIKGVMSCWIHNVNNLCRDDPRYCDDRGQRAEEFDIYFGLLHVAFCFVFVVVSIALVLWCTVRRTETLGQRWEPRHSSGGARSTSKMGLPLTHRTMETGVLFSASFLAVWLPSILLGFGNNLDRKGLHRTN